MCAPVLSAATTCQCAVQQCKTPRLYLTKGTCTKQSQDRKEINEYKIGWLAVWLVVFYVPSTARSFRDGTPIYCPLQRT